MKKSNLAGLFFASVSVCLLTACGSVKAPLSSENVVNMKRGEVEEDFRDAGFENINFKAIELAIADESQGNNEVKQVEIDGVHEFSKKQKFSKDAKVDITYYSKNEDYRAVKEEYEKDGEGNVSAQAVGFKMQVPSYWEVKHVDEKVIASAEMGADMAVEGYTNESDLLSLDASQEEKEKWLAIHNPGETNKFKLLSSRKMQCEAGEGILFDYIYSDDGVWAEGLIYAIPSESGLFTARLRQRDDTDYNYVKDFKKMCSDIYQPSRNIKISGVQFTIPEGYMNFDDSPQAMGYLMKGGYSGIMDALNIPNNVKDQLECIYMIMPEDYDPDSNKREGMFLMVIKENVFGKEVDHDVLAYNSNIIKIIINRSNRDMEFRMVQSIPGIIVKPTPDQPDFKGAAFVGLTYEDHTVLILSEGENKEAMRVLKEFLDSAKI